MTEALRFIPPRVQLVDPRTGMISREWYLFLQGVFNRVGGANGASTTDITASLFEDAGSSETNALLFTAEQAAGQNPLPADPQTLDLVLAELSAQRDQIAELIKAVQDLQQSVLL